MTTHPYEPVHLDDRDATPRKTQLGLLLGLLFLASCAATVQRSGPGMTTLDTETDYQVTPSASGFTLTMYVDRYQFVPALKALGEHCRTRFTTLAQELATQQGRAIQPVDPENVQLTVTREGFRGITSCTATAPVVWKE
jgi:hypothetical protein